MPRALPTYMLAGVLAVASCGVALAQDAPQDWYSQGMRATHALNMLEDRSDGQFSNFAASGQDFTANVVKNGQMRHVLINPDTNQITQAG